MDTENTKIDSTTCTPSKIEDCNARKEDDKLTKHYPGTENEENTESMNAD